MNKTFKIISIVLLILGAISMIAGIAWQVSGRSLMRNLFISGNRGEFSPPEGSKMPASPYDSVRPSRFGFRPWMPFNLSILLIGGGVFLLLAGVVLLLIGNRKKGDEKTPATITKSKKTKQVKSK